ncbi:thioredoxin, mitochondrial-like [Amphiura filiformis]|uniref:thioredoxin, mitochondrial-like n=1 Tax=Amphiura filiformis TaxID=82378 RepID=UPI003B20ECF5
MAQKAVCRLAVIRSMMTRTSGTSTTGSVLQTNFIKPNQRLWLQQCSSYSSDQGSASIFNIQDSDDFKDRVLNSKIPSVVDFHAGWCAPCKMLAPRLEKAIEGTKGKVQLAKVDIDENTDLAIDYDVSSVPTVLAVKDGKIIDKFIGLQEAHSLKLFVENLY